MRMLRAIPVALMVFVVYIVFSGSTSIYDIFTGSVVAIVVGILTANLVVHNYRKALNPIRLLWLAIYAVIYFFYCEVQAHIDVIKRILHPRMPVNPGIVRIPYDVETDYGIMLIANSITNTPGTVVVDVDKQRKILYVHWIDVKTTNPDEARAKVSALFEKFAKKVFE